MTCIVAVSGADGVVMGGDSAGVSGWDLQVRADEKVFRRGRFLMGFTDSFRMGQLLRYRLDAPPQREDLLDLEYMATEFVDAVRRCLGEGGWRKRSDEREHGGTFLVGYRGVIYQVASDFQVGIAAAGYDAVGCGASYALGALHALPYERHTSRSRVLKALDAASEFSAVVRGPYTILDSRDAPMIRGATP